MAVVDLAGFMERKDPVTAITDYYFQLQRAKPGLHPIFAFLYELADERCDAFKRIASYLEDEASSDVA